MTDIAWLIPVFPLLGGIMTALFGRGLGQRAHWPVVGGIGIAAVLALLLLPAGGRTEAPVEVARWITVGDLTVDVSLRIDGLSTMMLAMVTFVALLVAIFAAGYMSGDPGYPRFFALVGLFVFSMTGLVLSNHYVLTYAFWEGVGVCSYLLIGFWHAKPAAAAAAKKAFLVNRVGDLGFAVAIFWMFSAFGSLRYEQILSPEALAQVPDQAKWGIGLLLFWAATAKSAQVPLYVWLPDAMEGPTPVSALIHAATMVTAGVYLIARSSLLVFAVPSVAATITVVGCTTAVLAALIAVTQTDLKRVLAYSTVSQLGFMFMALGCGVGQVMQLAVVAAMFHLFTHAFFKALLFLGSGSVMHAMGGVIDMRRFSGLRHRMPITCWTFAIGTLALSGIPPLAGFFSKDEVLVALKDAGGAGGSLGRIYGAVYWVALGTAFLTAFYSGRAFFKTFFGPEKLPAPSDPEADPGAADHAHASDAAGAAGHGHGNSHGDDAHGHDSHFGHEAPPVMWVPLAILAVCTCLVGLIFGPLTHIFAHHVEHSLGFEALGHPEHGAGVDWMTVGLGTLAGLSGLGLAWLLYREPTGIPEDLAARMEGLYRASRGKFFVDEAYLRLIVRPLRGLAQISAIFDLFVVDGLVRLVGWLPKFIGRDLLRPIQNGLMQYYAAVTAIGVALLLVILMLVKT
jgi:NADH-quinone oxidoreductase subunit L